MSITDKTIKEIQRSYIEDFGEEISHAETKEAAGRLLELYRLLARATPSELAAMKMQGSDPQG